jgi:predicted O-methyltransferase YrrM
MIGRALGGGALSRVRARVDPLVAPLVFRLAARSRTTPEAAIELASGFRFGVVYVELWQVHSEILGLLGMIRENPPSCVLEIGTCRGGTLFLLSRFAAPDAHVISVDVPAGRFGGGYSPTHTRLYRAFAGRRQRLQLVLGDSHEPSTLETVETKLGGRQLDLLFIDGDHTYEGARRDFEMYAPLVRDGGLIAFHDIVPGPPHLVGGVPRLWQELRTPEAREFVESWSQGGFGIGVLRRAADAAPAVAEPAETSRA